MKTLITIEVTHEKPLSGLADKVANRAWSVDGVTRAEVVTPAQKKDEDGFTIAELALGSGEVHRS